MRSAIKHKKELLSGLLLMIGIVFGFAQGLTSVKTQEFITKLNIGDRVPNIEIKNLINAPKSNTQISDYKGKLLILDFWEVGCMSCITALPKIEKLQKKFAGQLEVITVTSKNTKEEVLASLHRFEVLKNFSLPTVIHDDKLFKYFPFKLISHVVWIDGQGTVKAITGTEHITEENIKQVLEGKATNWPVKNDIVDFDYNRPLLDFINPNVSRPQTVFSSTFTGSIDGVDGTSAIHVDSISNTVTINYFNAPLIDVCKGAIKGEITGDFGLKEVILEAKDPSRYEYILNGTYWTEKGTQNELFCYSACLPATLTQEEIRKFVSTDISRWLTFTLGITVKKETRQVQALNLVRTSNNNSLLSKGGKERIDRMEGRLVFSNTSIETLIQHLNSEEYPIPYVYNATGLSQLSKIDLEILVTPSSSIKDLRNALAPYGLDLVETQRTRSMYIITEKDFEPRN